MKYKEEIAGMTVPESILLNKIWLFRGSLGVTRQAKPRAAKSLIEKGLVEMKPHRLTGGWVISFTKKGKAFVNTLP